MAQNSRPVDAAAQMPRRSVRLSRSRRRHVMAMQCFEASKSMTSARTGITTV